jgi:cytochrome c
MAMHSVGGNQGSGGPDPLLGNKIAGAILGTLLFAMGLNIFSGVIYTPKKPAVPGYDLPAPEVGAAAGGSDQQAQAEPLPILLASADPAKGQASSKKCLACHSIHKGEPNKIGPNLYGVIGHPKGAHEGFNYSAAMKGKGGQWTFEELNTFIANPKGYVPGTIMAFAGIGNPKERADLIRYLQTLSDAPVPLPAAEAAPAAQPAAAPGPSQTQQQPSPAMPGQRAEPAPAALQANPQSAQPQSQPNAQQQPSPTRPPDPAQTTPPQTQPRPK